MIEKDLENVVEFSIKYPRGEMGMSANDQEQNILIEFYIFMTSYLRFLRDFLTFFDFFNVFNLFLFPPVLYLSCK